MPMLGCLASERVQDVVDPLLSSAQFCTLYASPTSNLTFDWCCWSNSQQCELCLLAQCHYHALWYICYFFSWWYIHGDAAIWIGPFVPLDHHSQPSKATESSIICTNIHKYLV